MGTARGEGRSWTVVADRGFDFGVMRDAEQPDRDLRTVTQTVTKLFVGPTGTVY